MYGRGLLISFFFYVSALVCRMRTVIHHSSTREVVLKSERVNVWDALRTGLDGP